jgi:5S rRNA maturation endonuclease (ribonuclease M5)
MLKNYLLKILDIDSDGNIIAKIIDEKLKNIEVFIPYNKQNPAIKIGDTVSSLIKYKKKV